MCSPSEAANPDSFFDDAFPRFVAVPPLTATALWGSCPRRLRLAGVGLWGGPGLILFPASPVSHRPDDRRHSPSFLPHSRKGTRDSPRVATHSTPHSWLHPHHPSSNRRPTLPRGRQVSKHSDHRVGTRQRHTHPPTRPPARAHHMMADTRAKVREGRREVWGRQRHDTAARAAKFDPSHCLGRPIPRLSPAVNTPLFTHTVLIPQVPLSPVPPAAPQPQAQAPPASPTRRAVAACLTVRG